MSVNTTNDVAWFVVVVEWRHALVVVAYTTLQQQPPKHGARWDPLQYILPGQGADEHAHEPSNGSGNQVGTTTRRTILRNESIRDRQDRHDTSKLLTNKTSETKSTRERNRCPVCPGVLFILFTRKLVCTCIALPIVLTCSS